MSLEFLNQLPTPADIKRDYPLSPELRELKKHRDLMISDVITGKDSRVLVIIGPCSADNEDSVCDYVSRLTKIQEDVKDQVILVPRIYTNKPRTTGEGYKGHVFWDTEVFLLPFHLFSDPTVARSLLRYRWHNLPGAQNAHPCNRRKRSYLCR